jgi:N-acetylneuraminate synthase
MAKPELEARKHWELPLEFIPTLSAESRSLGLEFGCTPFYLDAVGELLGHVDFFKVASYELLWADLLASVASTSVPIILSTGMANLSEVKAAVSVLEDAGAREIELLHCVSAYPCEPEETNLAAIETLRLETSLPVGWSDHSHDRAVVVRAIGRWQASSLEFHLDLDGEGAEFSPGHCWLPHEIEEIISESKRAKALDGSGLKVPTKSEEVEKLWRADPQDGLRPLAEIREKLTG